MNILNISNIFLKNILRKIKIEKIKLNKFLLKITQQQKLNEKY